MLLESPEQRQLMIEEANARDVPAIDLDTRDLSLPCFELAGAELVCASGKTLQAWENRLPGDLIPSNDALPPLPDWEAHRSSYPQLPEKFQEALIWADEIAWRQIRAYELRQNPDEQQYLLDELDALLPKGKTAQQGTRTWVRTSNRCAAWP
nr:hypothetical protein KXZ65_04895 [Pectobacterium sp. PL152]